MNMPSPRGCLMLNKAVCMKCWDGDSNWIEGDSSRWEEGKVICYCKLYDASEKYRSLIDITHPPPPCCPFKFEHAVAEGCVNIDKK
jgi:hypothetical protein